MSRTQEQREAGRLRRERRSQRMAGDALTASSTDEGSSSSMSARDEGFRNSLERNLGSEEYGRIGAEGLNDADNKGRYSAAEVKSEFRNSDKDVEGMTEYFQGLADNGSTFNKRARSFLEGKGVTFGGSGGGGSEDDTPGNDTATPTPSPSPTPESPGQTINPPPVSSPPLFGGNSQTQNINQDNDVTTNITGDNNTVTNNQDNSISQSMGSSDYATRYARGLKDQYVLNLLNR